MKKFYFYLLLLVFICLKSEAQIIVGELPPDSGLSIPYDSIIQIEEDIKIINRIDSSKWETSDINLIVYNSSGQMISNTKASLGDLKRLKLKQLKKRNLLAYAIIMRKEVSGK